MLTLVAAVNLSRINPAMLAGAEDAEIFCVFSEEEETCSPTDARDNVLWNKCPVSFFFFLQYVQILANAILNIFEAESRREIYLVGITWHKTVDLWFFF